MPLVHAIIPHVHHSHSDSSSFGDHHHDNFSHHHHSNEKSPLDQDGFQFPFDCDFGHHTHSCFNEARTIEVGRNFEKKHNVKQLLFSIAIFVHKESFQTPQKQEIPEQFKGIKLENQFLLSSSLRAPPQFV